MSNRIIESYEGFDQLCGNDQSELRKFERFLRLRQEPGQTSESAYEAIYGEVVFENKEEV